MSFYSISQSIRDTLNSHPDVNTVTLGNLNQVDLNSQTIWLLAHIEPQDVTISNNMYSYNFNVLVMGRVDWNKENAKNLDPDYFIGNDDLHDMWNKTLNVLTDLFLQANKGSLHDNLNITVQDPLASPFFDRFENGLAGWEMTLNIQAPMDYSIC